MLKSIRNLLASLLLLTPLVFWTLTSSYFSSPKQLLLILLTCLSLLIFAFFILSKHSLALPNSPLNLPLLLLTFGLILNLSLNQEARTEALMGRGSLYLVAITLSYLTLIVKNKKTPDLFLKIILISNSLLALHSILQLTFMHNLSFFPSYMQTQTFTLTGSPLISLTLFFIGIVTSLTYLTKLKNSPTYYLVGLAAGLQTIALIAYLSLIFSKQLNLTLLPFPASWSIALDAIKTPRLLLLGVGLANFSSFFTTVKPLFLNNTSLWSFLPSSSGSELLQLLTTGGLVVFLPFLSLLFPLAKKPSSHSYSLPLVALTLSSFAALVFTPTSSPLLLIFFISLALLYPSTNKTIPLSNSTSFLSFLILISLSFVSLFYTSKIALAEYHLHRGQLALDNGDAQVVYESHLRALSLAPSVTNYHLSYSQVNLQLAAAISQNQELSEEQRSQIENLLTQAIDHAKYATTLRPSLVTTWTNLSAIYQQLINIGEGAENFAISYLNQALTLDPANPSLRLNAGGLFYQLALLMEDETAKTGYLTQAINQFSTAARLKPDYANAWYNLAKSYELAGDIETAYLAMQRAIASLNPDSQDLSTATAELAKLKSQLPTPSPSPSPTSSPSASPQIIYEPSPLPSPLAGGPIELPKESTNSAQ